MYKKIIFITYVLLITTLSLFPANKLPITSASLFPHADKVVHFGMYAVFTFLLFYTWPDKFSGRTRQFLPLLYVIIWGSMMEILQGFGGYGRNFSHLDILANILGFFPGWIAWRVLPEKFKPAKPASSQVP
ncbi:MAG: hypothetical protein EA408_12760 [Marinilabiliales bacterium]|nr:MAG: hypothetical protein EA408_12760 [Marinilabiliales bacterium]